MSDRAPFVWPYHLPNFHMALDHAPVDAEREALLLLGADVTVFRLERGDDKPTGGPSSSG